MQPSGKKSLLKMCDTGHTILNTELVHPDFIVFLREQPDRHRNVRPIKSFQEYSDSLSDLRRSPSTHHCLEGVASPYFRCKMHVIRKFYYGTTEMNYARWYGRRVGYLTEMIQKGGSVDSKRLRNMVDVCSGGKMQLKSDHIQTGWYVHSEFVNVPYPIDVILKHEFVLRTIARIWELNT